MRRSVLVMFSAILCCLGSALIVAPMSPAFADSPAGQLVSDSPASHTPNVLDGRVYSVVQVGNTMVLGGTFTQASDEGSTTVLTRNSLIAFDATTGAISTTFLPNPNGEVRSVLPTGDGSTVWVGGDFTSIGGVARQNLARVRVSDGAVLSTFDAGPITGEVRELALSNGRLWIAGAFTHINGHAQKALATVDPETGAVQPYMGLLIDGVHNGGVTEVLKFDLNADGSKLVAIGNFDTVNGVQNHQIFMLDLTGPAAALAAFSTTFYTSACSSSFDSYMRDVSFSPDGSFFAVVTTGAYGGQTSACDESSRFETSGGAGSQPSWTNYTGGDTTYSVEVTNSAIYTGGHFRWQNNPNKADSAGQGAVSRPGLAALDAENGLPYTWNPTRTLGVGVFDFLSTGQGLWVASDTDRIGASQYRGRIALLPSSGLSFPAYADAALPNDVYLGGAPCNILSCATTLSKRHYDGTTVGANTSVPAGGINWNNVRGEFMLNGSVYLAMVDGTFVRRTFNGTTFGAAVPVNAQDAIVKLTDWSTDIKTITGMFYDNGRIYFTKSGSTSLFYRYFNPQSDIVGAQRLTASGNVSGIDFSAVRGMFEANSKLYWAQSDNNLHRINWQQRPQSGAPVAGTASIVAGPSVGGGASWSTRSMFLFQDGTGGGVGSPPTASFSQSCTSLSCDFDGSSSTAVGGSITSYAWDFGDGGTAVGAKPSHTFPSTGTYPVKLTVTANSGATASVTTSVSVVRINQLPTATFSWSCAGLLCSFDGSASNDPDGTIASRAWDFGDGGTATGPTVTHTFSGAGDQTVKLTVTDNDGGTDVATQTVTPTAQGVQFVGSSEANANASSQKVVVPAGVQAGDSMVLDLVVNSVTPVVSDPAGWTSLDTESGGNVQGRSWTRRATAADVGSTVTVPMSAIAKADLSLAVYRGSGGAPTIITAHDSSLDQTTSSTRTAPDVNVAEPGSWVATYFAAKGSTAITWSVPAGQQLRTSNPGSGSGLISAELVDSAASVPTGNFAGRTATTSSATTRAVMFTTVIGLGSATPTAAFSQSCTSLSCSFDGSASSTSVGSITGYAWDFGDGGTASGATPNHTFTTGGDHTVTLTVTDSNNATGAVTHTVTVTAAAVQFVASAETNANTASQKVVIPAGVQAGDTMVLTMAVNTSTSTVTAPAGWTPLDTENAANVEGWSWTRTATAADAGSTVSLPLSAIAKADVTVSAYRGSSGLHTTVDAHNGSIDQATATSHAAPSVNVADAGSWVLTYFAAKASVSVGWSTPADQQLRTSNPGSGSGLISAVTVDSGGPASTGPYSVTGTTSTAVTRVVMFAIVIGLE
ncbi:MAG: domain containing protein [Marmoricola sp.]|nr:domain containing protein [Marmoricola sp.]